MAVDLIQRQIELEDEAMGLGISRYRRRTQGAIERGEESSLTPQTTLLNKIMETLPSAIHQWMEQTGSGSRGKRGVKDFVAMFEYDQVAFVVTKCLLNGISRQQRLQAVALQIATLLEDELAYTAFKEKEPGLYKFMTKLLEKNSSDRHKRYVMLRKAASKNIESTKLSMSAKMVTGTKLINLFVETTGLVEVSRVDIARNKTVVVINAAPALKEWLKDRHSRSEVMTPVHMPMVIKPRPWTSPLGGGYLNSANKEAQLFRTRNTNYIDELHSVDLSNLYTAVNALQDTPWRVNKGVLEVMREVWDGGGSLGKLPPADDEPLPTRPHDIDTNKDARTEWKRAANKIHGKNARMQTKRLAIMQKLTLAEKFVEYDEIYFPWSLDWRGRAYPIPGYMQPQGDDSGKALLQFAEGKPLGENGAYWLAVHIANLFGEDKIPFDDRTTWVLDNNKAILDSALNPLDGERFWTTADKPYCALAACFEWAGYMLEGNDYVSHLPIAMDGSCNGLQNFSAMLRDDVGGKAVNLIPSDKPNDIYMQVADVVIRKVEDDNSEIAQKWLGHITRSIVKRPVMTLPYGATQAGMRNQIQEELVKLRDKGDAWLDSDDEWKAANYLAAIVYRSIGEVVIAAREAMDWLQDAAKVAASDGLPIRWTTPLGVPILQMYQKTHSKTVSAFIKGHRYRLTLDEYTDKINKRRMSSGISPNFVHSLDATHMMLTVLKCREHGITNFAMIHDSYGTHAADVDAMYSLLREAFVEQYSGDVLGSFRDELLEQLPEDLAKKLPPLPSKGGLDLEVIKDSEYFFA